MHATRAPGHWPPRRRARGLPRLAVVLAAAAFAGWEGVQGRFSTASHASILGTIGVVLVLSLVAGHGAQRKDGRTWVRDAARALRAPLHVGCLRSGPVAGALAWVLLLAATIGWDATSFVEQQHDLPTLSRLFGDVTDHDWGRAVVFAAWVVLGLYLATGWRRPLGRSGGDPARPAGGDPARPAVAARGGGQRPRPSRSAPPRDGGA